MKSFEEEIAKGPGNLDHTENPEEGEKKCGHHAFYKKSSASLRVKENPRFWAGASLLGATGRGSLREHQQPLVFCRTRLGG